MKRKNEETISSRRGNTCRKKLKSFWYYMTKPMVIVRKWMLLETAKDLDFVENHKFCLIFNVLS